MSKDLHPSILAEVDYEQQFMQSQQKGNRRVKIERGKMWTLRFLPAKLGPKGTWFARIARHWLSMKPIICPKYTSPDFGGDPEAHCPCCEIAAILNDSADEEISKFGYKVQGNPQWLTFCIVFDKDGVQQNQRELLLPYEFNHYKSTFEELMAVWKAGTRRTLDSILDYKSGNDFVVTKTGKGLKFDKQDAAPIFDMTDPNYKSFIQKIESEIKMPKIQIPTDDQLYAFSLKIQEWADKMSSGHDPASGGGGGRRRPPADADADIENGGDDAGYHENDDPAPAAPARRPAAPAAAPAAARRPAPARAPEPQPEPEPDPAEEPVAETPAEDESNPELMPEKAPAPAARRPAPVAAAAAAPRRTPAAAAAEVEAPAPRRPAPAAAASQPLSPSPRRAAAAVEAKSSVPEEPGEEEDLPEEPVDQAPPTETPMAEGEEQAEPPAVTRKGGTGLGSAIRGKIDNLARRGA